LNNKNSDPNAEHAAIELSVASKMSLYRKTSIGFRKFVYRNSNLAPLVSGDSLKEICDYVAFGKDGSEPFDRLRALSAKSIFVKAELLEQFMQEGGRLGLSPDVIITGNSDRNFEASIPQPLNCRLWICQNNAMPERQGLITLPIGLENRTHGRLGQPRFYSKDKRREIKEVTKVLVPPMRPTNPNRIIKVKEAELNLSVYDVRREYLPEDKYFNFLTSFQFVLCLEGNGFDTHRIWEALYLGVFPVVIESDWSVTLRRYNLPIMFIKSIDDLSKNELEEFVDIHKNFDPDNAEVLWTPYWEQVIRKGRLL
jgi:hypothetical protein